MKLYLLIASLLLLHYANGQNVGIGNTNPSYQLDVSQRMRIRSGGNNATSAGIWLNNSANVEKGFIGMENDEYMGFFGNSSAGWKFSMNVLTGALKINGSVGQSGQILRSNGLAAPEWRNNPVADIYNQTEELLGTGSLTLQSPNLVFSMPGLNKTIVLTKPSKVILSFMIYAASLVCTFCGPSDFDVVIQMNNSTVSRMRYVIQNGYSTHVTGKRIFHLNAGQYFFNTGACLISGPQIMAGLSASTYPSNLTIEVIPQD